MTWFKVDDTFAIHPKVVQAGNDAIGLWARAGSWCSQQLTGGRFPAYMVPVLGGNASQCESLVRVGLWDEVPDGYQFHGWDEWQPDSDSERSRRQAVSEARRQAGARGNHKRWHAERGVIEPGCPFCSPNGESQTDRNSESGPIAPTRPDPTRPTTSYGSSSSSTREAPESNPQPEMSVNAVLAAAGLAQHEHRDFLVELKRTGANSTARVVNSLHRDGKLARRIAEWRDERNLAAEAASRPTPGKKTTSDKVRDGFDLARRLAAEEAAADNVTQLRQIEGA